MADAHHIRNPVEWVWDHVGDAAISMGSLGQALLGGAEARNAPLPAVRRINFADLREALAKGIDDFEAYRSDVIRGGQPPQQLSIDLAGTQGVTLTVDYADRGDELDYADWLDARLVKE